MDSITTFDRMFDLLLDACHYARPNGVTKYSGWLLSVALEWLSAGSRVAGPGRV